MGEDKFIISSIKDSKKISKVLANDTSRDVLDLLAERSMSAQQIAEKMKLPLTTVDYSLKNLESVGLIKARNGFNKNKRIVKYYEPQEKFIVLSPGKTTNVLPILKTLLPAILIIVVAFFALDSFIKTPGAVDPLSKTNPFSQDRGFEEGIAQNIPSDSSRTNQPSIGSESGPGSTQPGTPQDTMFVPGQCDNSTLNQTSNSTCTP